MNINRKTRWIVHIYCFLSVENLALLQKNYPHRWGGGWGCGMQNLRLSFTTFEQGGIFIVPHLLWHRASVLNISIRRKPFSWLLPQGRGILTQIPLETKKNWMYWVTQGCNNAAIHWSVYWFVISVLHCQVCIVIQ